MAATAARYDRPSIFRDAWTRARQAAAAAAESARLYLGAGLRAAWAAAKGALKAPEPVPVPVPVAPVQLDLVEYIASLPPVAAPPAPAPVQSRRFDHEHHVSIYTRMNDSGLYRVDVYGKQAGCEVLLGSVSLIPAEYSGEDEALADAISVIEEPDEAEAPSVVEQPAALPEPEPQETEESRLTARLAELERERDELRADFIAARRERMAIVSGDIEGDAGIAWTNEERAQADYDEAAERYEEAYQDLWHATDIAA